MEALLAILKICGYTDFSLNYINNVYEFELIGIKKWCGSNLNELISNILDEVRRSACNLNHKWYKEMVNIFDDRCEYIPSYKELLDSKVKICNITIFDLNNPNVNNKMVKNYKYDLEEIINYADFAYIYSIMNIDDKICIRGLTHVDILLEHV